MELPYEIQEYILSLLGIQLNQFRRCRATTYKKCMCSRKPLKNNFFCFQHNYKLLKLKQDIDHPFSAIISIVLMYYPAIRKYKSLGHQYFSNELHNCNLWWYIKTKKSNNLQIYIVKCNEFTVKNLCFKKMLKLTPLHLTMRQYVCDSCGDDRLDEDISNIEIKMYINTHKACNLFCDVSYTRYDNLCGQLTWITNLEFDYDKVYTLCY